MSTNIATLGQPSRHLRPEIPFFELVTTSNFSFLRGGSHPEELAQTAASLGLNGFGLCDRNSFAGVVRAYAALRNRLLPMPPDFRYLVGTRLCFADGTPDIVAYPTDRAAYGLLCRLLSIANANGTKGNPKLTFDDLCSRDLSDPSAPHFAGGQLFILIVDERDWDKSTATLEALTALAPCRVWIAGTYSFKGQDRARLNRLEALGQLYSAPLIATNDVLYHEPGRRVLQDVVTCIREHLTILEAGRRLEQNAERHMKPASEMARLFREHPDALLQTKRFAEKISFSLDDLKYNYPTEALNTGEPPQETLERLTWVGAAKRFPDGIPDKVKAALWSELCLIAYKAYAPYFLTVYDIVRHARETLRILCQGRGSAANSTVCFCLGITEVNPTKVSLVFGRFLSTERDEPPDIDVDFEHERREEIMQYVYNKYGGNHTGLTANVICYRGKSSIREVAKVFGLSDDVIATLNQTHWGWSVNFDPKDLEKLGLDPHEPTLSKVLECAHALREFPRHLSQHVGGFVITRDQLDHLVPISKTAMDSRTIIEWNKDDIDALGILKVDVLALGMLSCLRRAFELLHVHYKRDVEMTDLLTEEHDNPEAARPVYEMTHRADTVGVFQIESRAQMSMLPRLKPREFYDLIIEVAIVRPGPIQGGMVHPYLKRRLGNETVTYPSEALREVLEKTEGVPLFQEQAMQIAVVGANFSPGEADRLRRSMATFKRTGGVGVFRDKFLAGMKENNYPADFAEACFRQIEGFGSYGFPESHAASFALLVYVSCWLKCHYPDVFTAALLNSQPMGFYAPPQLIRDAVEHGVEIRGADINRSDYWCILEEGQPAANHVWPRHSQMKEAIWSTRAVRLGLAQLKGLKEDHAMRLMARRGAGYGSIRDLWLRTELPIATLEVLAEADAFQSLGYNRRAALWAVRGLIGTEGAETLPLFKSAPSPSPRPEIDPSLPLMSQGEDVIHDYRTLTYSLKAHPLSFMRRKLNRRGVVTSHDLSSKRNGDQIEVAGLVLVRQRPGTASGIVFATLEDETGIANIVIWNRTFEANRNMILGSRLLAVKGKLQVEGLVIHVIAESFADMTEDLTRLANGHAIGDAVIARGDEGKSGPRGGRDAGEKQREELQRRQARAALPGGRNFH
ncbi:MAG: error-prone DNA polymerase [Devosia sp.]